MSSSRTAPASGMAHRRVSRAMTTPNTQLPSAARLSPQVVPQDDHNANQQRSGIGPDRSGLQPAQHGGATVDNQGGAVDGAVNHFHVKAAPQSFGRDHLDWL